MAYHGNSWEKKLVKVTFQSGDDVMSWETPYWDEPLEDIIRGFAGLLVADGHSEEGVAEEMFNYAIWKMKPKDIYNTLYDNGIEDEDPELFDVKEPEVIEAGPIVD